jgi:hypothetical protein
MRQVFWGWKTGRVGRIFDGWKKLSLIHHCGVCRFCRSLWDDGMEETRQMTPKRPRDPNQLAKSIIDIATGQAPDTSPDDKDPAAVPRGRPIGKLSIPSAQSRSWWTEIRQIGTAQPMATKMRKAPSQRGWGLEISDEAESGVSADDCASLKATATVIRAA